MLSPLDILEDKDEAFKLLKDMKDKEINMEKFKEQHKQKQQEKTKERER